MIDKRKENWELTGGSLEIPDGYYVNKVDLDCYEPYCIINSVNSCGLRNKGQKVLIPKALAYYLSVHFCGSDEMHDLIEKNTIRDMQNKIKYILGI